MFIKRKEIKKKYYDKQNVINIAWAILVVLGKQSHMTAKWFFFSYLSSSMMRRSAKCSVKNISDTCCSQRKSAKNECNNNNKQSVW